MLCADDAGIGLVQRLLSDPTVAQDAIEAASAVLGHIGKIGPTRPEDHAFVVTNAWQIAVLDAGGQEQAEEDARQGQGLDQMDGFDTGADNNTQRNNSNSDRHRRQPLPFVKVIGQPARVDEVQSVMKCEFEDGREEDESTSGGSRTSRSGSNGGGGTKDEL